MLSSWLEVYSKKKLKKTFNTGIYKMQSLGKTWAAIVLMQSMQQMALRQTAFGNQQTIVNGGRPIATVTTVGDFMMVKNANVVTKFYATKKPVYHMSLFFFS